MLLTRICSFIVAPTFFHTSGNNKCLKKLFAEIPVEVLSDCDNVDENIKENFCKKYQCINIHVFIISILLVDISMVFFNFVYQMKVRGNFEVKIGYSKIH